MATATSGTLDETVFARDIAWKQVMLGGLLVAIGDIVFATTRWFSWDAYGLQRVFQSIAVGVLGTASFDGGVSSALLGAVLHLFMATMFVAAYALVARRFPAILRRLFTFGVAYGVVMYVIMNFIVMPLSRVGRTPSLSNVESIAWSVAAHMVFGMICVAFARRALGRR